MPVQVTHLIMSCKQDLIKAVASLDQLDDPSNATTPCDDSEHAMIAGVIMESVQGVVWNMENAVLKWTFTLGRACLHFLYDIIINNQVIT